MKKEGEREREREREGDSRTIRFCRIPAGNLVDYEGNPGTDNSDRIL